MLARLQPVISFPHGAEVLRHVETEVLPLERGQVVLDFELARRNVCFKRCARCGWSRVAGILGFAAWALEHGRHGP